ncbi:MAG: hypothetical protein WCX30_01265 [Candidatus Paceibacterota bacterium]|jgi:hypothetical protein|nr:hypothetical protein [bacterium]
MEDFYEEKTEEDKKRIVSNVRLYVDHILTAGDGLVLIAQIIRHVKEGDLGWEDTGTSQEELLALAETVKSRNFKKINRRISDNRKRYDDIRTALRA